MCWASTTCAARFKAGALFKRKASRPRGELQWQALNIADLEDLSGEALHVHGAARAANLATPIASSGAHRRSRKWSARCLGHAGLRDLDCSGNGLGDNGAHEIVEASSFYVRRVIEVCMLNIL